MALARAAIGRVLRAFRSLVAVALLVGGLSALAVLGLRSASMLEPLELTAYDWLVRTRPPQTPTHPPIVLLGITEEDIRRQGRWPLTDATLAAVLERLLAAQPRAIGVDIYRDIPVPPGRTRLRTVLASDPRIICVTRLGGGHTAEIPAPPVLQGTDQVGFNDLLPDPDGTIRRGLLFQDHGELVAWAFGLRLALLYLAEEGIYPEPDPQNPQHLRLGPTTLRPFRSSDGGYVGADAGGYQVLLNYQRPLVVRETFSLTDLLEDRVSAETIRGKVVLIGVTAESVPDLLYSPYGMVHGVQLHGHVVSQLLGAGLDGLDPIQTWAENTEGAWIVTWSLLGAVFGLWAKSAWRFVAGGAVLLLVLVLAAFQAYAHDWWIPLVPSALAGMLSASVVTAGVLQRERRDRAVLRQLFGKHVSEDVAEALWRQREQFMKDGRPRSRMIIASVLFADFKGYTAVSEKMDPQALMSWLNSYLDVMSQAVMRHHGFVDDYAGDAIKANFYNPLAEVAAGSGAEEAVAQDAMNAVSCARAMEEELHRLNAAHEAAGLPTVGMRVGIHTGAVVAGTVGSLQRMKYTTVGDTVNTAARLESLDREFVAETPGRRPCRILISETTATYLRERVEVEGVGQITVKGKEEPISVYKVLPARPGM